jgi:hypothetical protein
MVQSIGEVYVVIKKRFFGGYESIEEGSEFKASITWDFLVVLFTLTS